MEIAQPWPQGLKQLRPIYWFDCPKVFQECCGVAGSCLPMQRQSQLKRASHGPVCVQKELKIGRFGVLMLHIDAHLFPLNVFLCQFSSLYCDWCDPVWSRRVTLRCVNGSRPPQRTNEGVHGNWNSGLRLSIRRNELVGQLKVSQRLNRCSEASFYCFLLPLGGWSGQEKQNEHPPLLQTEFHSKYLLSRSSPYSVLWPNFSISLSGVCSSHWFLIGSCTSCSISCSTYMSNLLHLSLVGSSPCPTSISSWRSAVSLWNVISFFRFCSRPCSFDPVPFPSFQWKICWCFWHASLCFLYAGFVSV